VEDKMNIADATASPERTQAPARRDRRFYFWIVSMAAALAALALTLLGANTSIVLYALIFLVAAYLTSWAGILIGKGTED
jgi:hypothetical protein